MVVASQRPPRIPPGRGRICLYSSICGSPGTDNCFPCWVRSTSVPFFHTSTEILQCFDYFNTASIDQELNVIRFNPKLSTIEGEDPYKMERVGRVRIKEIINEHFASVELVSGEVKVNDMVELKKCYKWLDRNTSESACSCLCCLNVFV